MNDAMQHRLKSPVFWSAVIAQMLSILVLFDVIDLNMSEAITNVVFALLELLVTFGILNNPTNPRGL